MAGHGHVVLDRRQGLASCRCCTRSGPVPKPQPASPRSPRLSATTCSSTVAGITSTATPSIRCGYPRSRVRATSIDDTSSARSLGGPARRVDVIAELDLDHAIGAGGVRPAPRPGLRRDHRQVRAASIAADARAAAAGVGRGGGVDCPGSGVGSLLTWLCHSITETATPSTSANTQNAIMPGAVGSKPCQSADPSAQARAAKKSTYRDHGAGRSFILDPRY